jgi:hypothetical protein
MPHINNDSETTYFKLQCIGEDFEPLLDMFLKTSLLEKNFAVFGAKLLENYVADPEQAEEIA